MYQAEHYQSLNSQGLISLQLLLKSQGWEWLTVTIFLRYLIDWLQLLSMEFAGYKNYVVRYLPLKLLCTELELTCRLLKTSLYS